VVPEYLPDMVVYLSTPNGAERYHFDGFDIFWTPILAGTPVVDIAVQFIVGFEVDWFATNTYVAYYDGNTWTNYSSGKHRRVQHVDSHTHGGRSQQYRLVRIAGIRATPSNKRRDT